MDDSINGAMMELWFLSYVFLGLSLAIGVCVYLVYRDISKKRKSKRENSLLAQLEKEYLHRDEKDEEES